MFLLPYLFSDMRGKWSKHSNWNMYEYISVNVQSMPFISLSWFRKIKILHLKWNEKTWCLLQVCDRIQKILNNHFKNSPNSSHLKMYLVQLSSWNTWVSICAFLAQYIYQEPLAVNIIIPYRKGNSTPQWIQASN